MKESARWTGSCPAAPPGRRHAGDANIDPTMQYYVSIRPKDMAEAREVIAQALLLDLKLTQNSMDGTR